MCRSYYELETLACCVQDDWQREAARARLANLTAYERTSTRALVKGAPTVAIVQRLLRCVAACIAQSAGAPSPGR